MKRGTSEPRASVTSTQDPDGNSCCCGGGCTFAWAAAQCALAASSCHESKRTCRASGGAGDGGAAEKCCHINLKRSEWHAMTYQINLQQKEMSHLSFAPASSRRLHVPAYLVPVCCP